MSLQDPISDMLTRMRNIIRIEKESVRIPYSKLKAQVLDVLKREGFIKNYEVISEQNKKDILVYLKYADSGVSVLNSLKRVSKPSCRVYKQNNDIKPVLGGLGISILTTSKGVLSDRECRDKKVGGELICEIY